MRLRKTRWIGLYNAENRGKFKVFRETISRRRLPDPPVVIVVGFRLKLAGTNPLLHWLFQGACIVTTPFWSGLKGYRVKLWLVDPATKNYLGIYDWQGQANAENYIDFLLPILKCFSIPNSVWYKIYTNQKIEAYLNQAVD
ncbi:MAG: hypothetical protein V1853_05565 [bacterium]